MKIIEKSLVLPKDKFFEKHLAIINPLLPVQLTYKEIEVISSFLTVEAEIGKRFTFSNIGRKEVKKKLDLSNGGLSNYIRALKEKKIILEDENKELYILDILKPTGKTQGYQIKLSIG